MYRILVVDDEPIATESVVFMLGKHFPDLRVVGTSRSGRDAIEKAYSLRPDIVIMDINMPGINGLDAIRLMKETNPDINILVISAFDSFEYAVEAIALGTQEYLLKPVKEAKFTEAIAKVISRIDQKREDMKKELAQQERLEMVLPMLEVGFINAICLYDENSGDLQQFCQLFNQPNSGGYVVALEFGQKSNGSIQNRIGAGVHSQRMYDDYRKILKSSETCVVGPIMLNRIIVYVFNSGDEKELEQRTAAIQLAQNIIKRAERLYPDIFIGIGRRYNSILDAKKSYHEALHALHILTSGTTNDCSTVQNRILHADDVIEKDEYFDNDYEKQYVRSVLDNIAGGDIQKAVASFERIFSEMQLSGKQNLDSMKNNMIGVVAEIGKRWGSAFSSYSNVIGDIIKSENPSELHSVVSRYANEFITKISSVRSKKVNNIIEKANKYLDEHYTEDISLDDISKVVNLSSFYFSRFYKDEVGINFSDKLTNMRIDKAKELLVKEDLSIKDVSYMVGYTDPNYFSKLFKKSTGKTASEYKKSLCL